MLHKSKEQSLAIILHIFLYSDFEIRPASSHVLKLLTLVFMRFFEGCRINPQTKQTQSSSVCRGIDLLGEQGVFIFGYMRSI